MPVITRNVLCGVFLAVGVAGTAWASDKQFDQHFTAQPGSEVRLRTDVGSISVVGHDTRDVSIHADVTGNGAEEVEIEAQQHGTEIEINGHAPGFHLNTPQVRFTLEIPRDCATDLKTSGSGIEVRGLNAAVRGNTSGSAIQAQDIKGAVTLHSSGGAIAATHVTGDLNLDTAGGSITLADVDGAIRAQTSGGGVHVDARSNHGIAVTTAGGSITLQVPADTRADVDASTSGGHVRLQLPLTRTDLSESTRLKGQIGGGGDQIVLHTSGGGIEISAR
jgi:hypothetical protein